MGKRSTCNKKTKYKTEESAIEAVNIHNQWEGRHHNVGHYPCPFCNKWHIGAVLAPEILELFG
jgi:hypothetical protein